MRWLCLFRECEYVHLLNAQAPAFSRGRRQMDAGSVIFGLYQCPRCKTVSIGSPRYPDQEGDSGRPPLRVVATDPPASGGA